MERKLCYLLVMLCIVLMVFSSCGSDNETKSEEQSASVGDESLSEETTENTEDLNFKDDLPALNFDGKVFTLLVEPDPSFRHFYDVNVEGEIGEIVNDTVYRRNRVIEERLGIVIKDVQDNNAPRTIVTSTTAGDTNYNGVWLKVDNFFSTSLQGVFTNLHNVPHLNLEKKYWDPNAVSDMTISGKLYGITGDITTATHMFTHLLMYNKDLAAEHGFPNLYDIVREGKWTYDLFDELTRNLYIDLNGDGKVDKEDFFSIDITPAAYEAFFSSAGEQWIGKNDNGEMIFSELTEKKVTVLERIEAMFSNKDNVLCGYEWPFQHGRAIFYDGDLGIMCYESREIDFNFGIVPLPKFSEQQDRYYVYAYPFFPFLAIPTTIVGEDLAMTGAAFEALAAESYRTLTPAFYDVALESKFTRDEESYEMLDIILRSRIYDILYWGQWDKFRNWGSGLVSSLQKGNGSYVSLYEKHIDTSNAKIDEIVDVYANLPD